MDAVRDHLRGFTTRCRDHLITYHEQPEIIALHILFHQNG
jgi:hypothetical protein